MPRSTKKAPRTRTAPKRQTRLTFTPVPASSSPGIEKSPGTADDKLANVRYLGANSSPLSTKRSGHPLASSSSPASGLPNTMAVVNPSSDEDNIRDPRSTRRIAKKPVIKPTFDGNDADSDDFVPSSPTKRKRRNGNPAPQLVEDEDDSDSEEIIASSPRKRRRRNVESSPQSESPDGEGDSDSEDIVVTSPVKRRRKTQFSPEIENARKESGSDSEDIVGTSPVKRRRKGIAPDINSSPRNNQELEDSDLAEDLADLQDSDTPVTKTRTRGRKAESATKLKRKEQLAALRRRRAGGNIREKTASPMEDNAEDSQPEDLGRHEASSSENELMLEEKDSDIESAAPEDLDEYEDDFVLQDDDSTLGVPAELVDVPFEFSRHRYKKLRDHFKDVIEWMVHNKLNPAFPRDDKVYQVAFMKVKDELTGVAGSQLMSSVWNVDFRRALEARPAIEISSFPVSAGHPCDACNRSKHPASYDVKFNGRPYMEETLEPVFDDDDSDEASEEGDNADSGNIDSRGNTIPNASKHFYLGRHCKTKAELAHTLMHWKYHLNEWVIDYLRIKGILADEKILERERWSVRKRTRYANETVDMMDTSGEVNRLYKDFNLNIKTAKGLKESRW